MIKNKLILGLFLGMIVSVAKSKETPRDQYYKAQNKMNFKIELEKIELEKIELEKIEGSNKKKNKSKENENLITKLEQKYSVSKSEVCEALDILKKEVKEEYNKLSFKDKCMVACNNNKKEMIIAITGILIIIGGALYKRGPQQDIKKI